MALVCALSGGSVASTLRGKQEAHVAKVGLFGTLDQVRSSQRLYWCHFGAAARHQATELCCHYESNQFVPAPRWLLLRNIILVMPAPAWLICLFMTRYVHVVAPPILQGPMCAVPGLRVTTALAGPRFLHRSASGLTGDCKHISMHA
jgi:hypothetical protein